MWFLVKPARSVSLIPGGDVALSQQGAGHYLLSLGAPPPFSIVPRVLMGTISFPALPCPAALLACLTAVVVGAESNLDDVVEAKLTLPDVGAP